MIENNEWYPDVGEYLPENGDPPHPHDSMPVANGTNKYHPDGEPPDLAPCEYEPPMTDSDWFIEKPKDNYASRHKSTPDSEKSAEEVVTMHEKMYRIATARNNPFHVGGSENAQSEVDYIKKHSPWPGGSENFQGGSEQHMPPRPEEQIYDEFNDPYGGR